MCARARALCVHVSSHTYELARRGPGFLFHRNSDGWSLFLDEGPYFRVIPACGGRTNYGPLWRRPRAMICDSKWTKLSDLETDRQGHVGELSIHIHTSKKERKREREREGGKKKKKSGKERCVRCARISRPVNERMCVHVISRNLTNCVRHNFRSMLLFS